MDLHRPDPARLEQAGGAIAPGVSYAPDLAPAEPGDVVLELKDLTVRYDGRAVLDGVDAAFRRGISLRRRRRERSAASPPCSTRWPVCAAIPAPRSAGRRGAA